MEALKPFIRLTLGCPSIEYISASKKRIWLLRAGIMFFNFSTPHRTYNDAYYLEKLHKYLKICWCQILILHWMLEWSAKNLDLILIINGGKKWILLSSSSEDLLLVLLLPRAWVSNFKRDFQFPKLCGQFQGRTFRPLKPSHTSWEESMFSASASRLCWQLDITVASIRASLQHVNLE